MTPGGRSSADRPAPRRRFWTQAGVKAGENGFTIVLDGKPVLLPDRARLCVPSRALAEALAAEWQAAGADDPEKRFGADALPLTRIAGSMIEKVAPARDHSIAVLTGYGQHDLLCYRAASNDPLATRQAESWQPWLDWLATRHDARLVTTHGMMPVPQSEDAIAALRRTLAAQPDAILAALGVAVPALGSLTLGLALADGALNPDQAVELATLDERAQMARWGEDTAILDRIATMAADVTDASRFMVLALENRPT